LLFSKDNWCIGDDYCGCFPFKDFSEGIKYFKIESVEKGNPSSEEDACFPFSGQAEINYCVTIDEVSKQLS